ncbi:hypothetical protein V8E36_009305 [Tilletia maclaganii]
MRGVNLRNLALSDLELGQLQEGISPAVFLVIKVNESKTNRTGRTDYTGALRHSESVLDPHFALALYLYQRWHVVGEPFPDLSSNKSWYNIRLLRGKDDFTTPISYEAHKEPILRCFKTLDLTGCKKVTHAARGSGAREAELAGVATSDIERLGGWKQGQGAIEQSYLTHLPVRALRALAGFSPEGGTYFLRRDGPEPPEELLKTIFPAVETWQQQLKDGKISATGGADKFLDMLRHLRRVLLQDLLLLESIHATHPVLQHIKSEAFGKWATVQRQHLSQVTHPMELTLKAVMLKVSEQLTALADQQASVLNLVHFMQQEARTAAELQRRRDQAMYAELQRHTQATLRIQAGYGVTLSSYGAGPVNAANAAGRANEGREGGDEIERDDCRGGEDELSPGPLFITSAAEVATAADARALPHITSGDSLHALSPAVKTVAEAWQEWTTGFGGGPALEQLEKERRTKWCGGASSATRRAFLRRMVIIKAIRDGKDGSIEQRIVALQRKMGAQSLDWLRKELESQA